MLCEWFSVLWLKETIDIISMLIKVINKLQINETLFKLFPVTILKMFATKWEKVSWD